MRNKSVVRVRVPPSAATSPIVRRLPRAPSGTRRKQRAIGFSHTSRMFLNRLPATQTRQWIDPAEGLNSTRATSSNGCAACGGWGVAEITSIRTSLRAPDADDASVVAAANATANAASRLIMRLSLAHAGARANVEDSQASRAEFRGKCLHDVRNSPAVGTERDPQRAWQEVVPPAAPSRDSGRRVSPSAAPRRASEAWRAVLSG